MHYWRGVITHLIFLLAQPTYLAVRYVLSQGSFYSRSSLKIAINFAIWLYIATRISIPFFASPMRHLPSPPGEKFLLCHLNLNRGKPPTALLEDMINSTPNDGLLVAWLPLYLSYEIIPTRPDTLMDVLNSHNYDWEKPSVIKKVLSGMLGEGLVNVEGTIHKAMRRVVAPAFSGCLIRDLAPLFYSKGVALTEAMACQLQVTDDGVLDLMSFASRVSLDIIGAAGIGMEFNTIADEESRLAKLYELVAHPHAFFMLVATTLPNWFIRQLRSTAFAKTLRAQSQLREEIRALMQEKKAHINQKSSAQDSKDIIATIMRSGEFSDGYLMSQMLTFLAAGHDTGASALTWATWLLSLHPQIQDQLRTECNMQMARIDFATSDVDASIFDAQNMPFLTAVCNETLRLYPPVSSTARHSVVPTTIGDVQIPTGTAAIISPWAINRSRALWGADAGDFNPGRWLDGPNAAQGGAESPYAMLTFLHGPRSCIGQSFARLELKCLVAALFTRFRFEVADPDQKVEIGGFVTIKPEPGMRLRLYDLQKGS